MRVLLADDHRLLLEGLNSLLSAYNIDVAGMAHDGQEALELARQLRPDVILMDVRMPGWDGLEATRRIMAEMPDSKIVMLSASADDQDLFDAIRCGACGYLLKSMDADELVEALSQAQDGVPPFSPGLAARLLREFTRMAEPGDAEPAPESAPPAAQTLTLREREVLTLVAHGLTYKEVGARLFLSPRTVKYHMAEIMARLHLQHRAQVLAYAGRLGLNGEKSKQP